MKVLHVNHNSATGQALRLIDAAQKQTPYMGEGFKVLESVRRYLYRTAPADLWRAV